MPSAYVKASVKHNKNDPADAERTWSGERDPTRMSHEYIEP